MTTEQIRMQEIPIDDLLARPLLPVDVYVCVDSKYVLVAKSGTNAEIVRKFKERKLEHAFVRIEDYVHWVNITVNEAIALAGSSNTSDTIRFNSLKTAMYNVYSEIEAIGFNEQSFRHSRMVNHASLMFLAKTPRCLDMIAKLDEIAQNGSTHSMLVSMVATMVGLGHTWTKPGTIEKLALGGFLHDIGKTKLPLEVVKKKEHDHSVTDKVLYKSHPDVGSQMLVQVKSVPEDVILIVQQHHEYADGSGYPRGIKDLLISPLARVVALADSLAAEIERHGPTLPILDIVDQFKSYRPEKYNRDALAALSKLFPNTRDRKSA